MLSFTAEVLSSLLEAYNRAIWPAQLVACALTLAVVWLSLARRPRGRLADWLTGAVLAAAWGWTGAVFHLQHFAGINFMAPFYGAAFIAEALLVAGWTAWRGGLAPQARADLEGRAGLGLLAFALAGYPLLAVMAGEGIASAPVVGLAPGPTAVLTLALLLLARRPAPLSLAVVPVLWTLLAGWTAWELDLGADLTLPPIGFAALALLIRRRLRPPPASAETPG